MKVIACCPGSGKFWIACNKEEAEKWFVPLLNKYCLKQYKDILLQNETRRIKNPEYSQEYDNMIKEMMKVDDVAYAYFTVSRDLSICYAQVAHHPFHQLWNGYSPFCLCDQVEVNSPDELKDLVMTYQGKAYEKQ